MNSMEKFLAALGGKKPDSTPLAHVMKKGIHHVDA